MTLKHDAYCEHLNERIIVCFHSETINKLFIYESCKQNEGWIGGNGSSSDKTQKQNKTKQNKKTAVHLTGYNFKSEYKEI